MAEPNNRMMTIHQPNPNPNPNPTPRTMPVREDCWSEDATFTLIEAWGQRYLDLNRGNLRQKQWQEVADTVNALHGHLKKARRTDVQCKNRIDTLKKKYKIEKSRVLDSNASYVSPWPFYLPLDHLIGTTMPIKKVLSGSVSSPNALSPPVGVPLIRGAGIISSSSNNNNNNNTLSNMNMNMNMSSSNVGGMMGMGVSTPVLPQKRPMGAVEGSGGKGEEYFRRNYAAVAAAAAREEEEEEESEEEESEDQGVGEEREDGEGDGEEEGEGDGDGDGIRELAKVIEKFGEVYARVEREKQRQLVELEKQRMQFAKEMECQRMQMLVEMQVQLEKIKRARRSTNSDDVYNS